MTKVGKIVINIILVTLIVCFAIVLLIEFTMEKEAFFEYNKLLLILFIFSYIVVLYFIYKFLDKIKNLKRLAIIIISCIFIIQLIIGFKIQLSPGWDIGAVFNQACFMAGTEEKVEEYGITNTSYKGVSYTDCFSNNLFIVLCFTTVFKIASFFNINNYIMILTLINIVVINIAIIFTYLIGKKVWGEKTGVLALIISATILPFYLYGPIFYTDSLSIGLPLIIFYLYLLIKENSKNSRIYEILLGIIIFVSFSLKITSTFIVIAIILVEFFNVKILKLLKALIVPILTTIFILSVYNSILYKLNIKNAEREKMLRIPYQHWVMMSLQGNGGWNGEAYAFTNSAGDYEAKKIAINSKIVETLNEYGLKKTMYQLKIKIVNTWCMGDYNLSRQLGYDCLKNSKIREVAIDLDETNGYIYMIQTTHYSLIVLMIFTAICGIKNKDICRSVLLVTVFGTFVFLLLWEVCARYVVIVIPIMVLLAAKSISELSELNFKNKKKIYEK